MNNCGRILYEKVRNLHSDLSNIVTPEILEEIYDEHLIYPFLKWFCENVYHFNIVSHENIQLKNKLQETNEWLEGTELDDALKEATASCPDLLKCTSFDTEDIDGLFAELEIVNNFYKEDDNYIYTLQYGIDSLKNLEIRLDEDLEKEEALLDRDCIEVNKAYKECSAIVQKFDEDNHKFFKEVEHLLNVYTDAAENKGVPLLWTQMPLKLFIQKIELYNHYLNVYIEQQFKDVHEEKEATDSDYVSLINNSKEECINNGRLKELLVCEKIFSSAKMKEILAKVQEDSYMAMLNHVQKIYNSGNLKVPRHYELRAEISKLIKKRDFFEENVSVLQEHQLTEIVQQFTEQEITKLLKQNADTKLEEAKLQLEKHKNLLFLTREHGHVYTDLLCMLMQMQFHRLKHISEFVIDAYHYLETEYKLSSTRIESMQQQQGDYSKTVISSPKEHNSFNQFFISMICNGDTTCSLNSALHRYNEVVVKNKEKKELILKHYLNPKIYKLEALENEVILQYIHEVHKGYTYTFKPISYEIETSYTEASDDLEKIQADITKIRTEMKERLKADASFEQEKSILWQRFLIDPDTLKEIYQKMKETANKSCFAKI